MFAKTLLSLAAAGLTAIVVWSAPSVQVEASTSTWSPLVDTDNDFLPDAVEWAVLTNAANPDTDGDGIADFIEVVQMGNPRKASVDLPLDQEMRLVVTGPMPGSSDPLTWMHVFVRVAGASPSLQSFSSWIELAALPGIRFELSAFAAAGVIVRERAAGEHGYWLQVSVPLVSANVLYSVLPCSIYAESVVAGRALKSGVKLVPMQGAIASIVPFGDERFVMQSLTPGLDGGSGLVQSNRVCVIELSEVGSGPGGTVYEVVAADCQDCNELECGPTCLDSIGWIITIPGGVGVLSGH
jgi:hypothetical protein